MNRLSNILLVILMVFLFSCKKIVEPIPGGLVINDVSVEVTEINYFAKADITATYYYPGDNLRNPRIYVSRSSNFEYGSAYELTYNGGVLSGTISSLNKNTVYYFCFVYYDGLKDIYIGSYSFTTTIE